MDKNGRISPRPQVRIRSDFSSCALRCRFVRLVMTGPRTWTVSGVSQTSSIRLTAELLGKARIDSLSARGPVSRLMHQT